jgi:hypothetical protein
MNDIQGLYIYLNLQIADCVHILGLIPTKYRNIIHKVFKMQRKILVILLIQHLKYCYEQQSYDDLDEFLVRFNAIMEEK